MPIASQSLPTQRHQLMSTRLLSGSTAGFAFASNSGITTRYCLPSIAILAAILVPSGDRLGRSNRGRSANTSTGIRSAGAAAVSAADSRVTDMPTIDAQAASARTMPLETMRIPPAVRTSDWRSRHGGGKPRRRPSFCFPAKAGTQSQAIQLLLILFGPGFPPPRQNKKGCRKGRACAGLTGLFVRPPGLGQPVPLCAASAASSSSATMLVILIIGFTAGPAVSL